MAKHNLKKSKEVKPRFFKKSDILGDIKKPQFPNIYRIITELVSKRAFWAGIVAGIILIGILIVGIDLKKNIAEKKSVEAEKSRILSEIKYWEEISKKYKGYRDAYFKLVLLEYKIGNVKESKEYLEKVFRLDPNFEPAIKFQDLLGLSGN